ncbi:uncharacterized protein BXZ73DRAFT_50367 [Epithele typhae]|uniref:uncharacterized protein n=1 Tax=Epithele typhae TaxID=378194 RepID=UPI0020088A03|nr:uncharacterized protein BXZ73DRAFT_50367 [Epithele typhae]KAH9924613.1 hypothetical protein BXZ73DRAFT_50367 [Epithele typhae]
MTNDTSISTSTTSNGTIISFPTVTSSVTPTPTTTSLTSTPQVGTEWTFLSGSSLALASTSSSTDVSTTATDPDEPTTTFTFASSAADSKPTQAALPSDLVQQILPAKGYQPGDPSLAGYSLVSILFDTALGWQFVVENSDSASQIFAWMSPILQAALSLTDDQVKTYKLVVYVPDSYTGPSDVAKLQTMYNAWIPEDQVDALAQQLKVSSSTFYNGLGSPYSDLASHVIRSFPVTSVGGTSGSNSDPSSNGSASSSSSSSKTREDAIIGVVTSLGAITLLILAFLVYRAIKQRRELAHRRLSDPHQNEFIGAPPEDHEFDRDSIGGQRRRSFYYAADSLRGTGEQHPPSAEDPFNPGMRERRPVIGTPILRDNTMNW